MDQLIHWNEIHKTIHDPGCFGSAISANSFLNLSICFSSSILIPLINPFSLKKSTCLRLIYIVSILPVNPAIEKVADQTMYFT